MTRRPIFVLCNKPNGGHKRILKGIVPFLAVELAFIVPITAFPVIVLFLPSLTGG